MAVIVMLVLFLYRSAQRRHHLTEQAMKNAYDAELLRTELEIAEAVSTQLSEDLHDNLGQLVSHAMHLHERNETESLGEVLAVLRKGIRNFSHKLNGKKVNQLGLDLAIEQLCLKTFSTYVPPCTFHSDDPVIQLTPNEEILLYRCVQQALENSYKHANASKIGVRVKVSDNNLILVIEDNGRGFDVNELHDGIGLLSIRNRSDLAGATLEIASSHGKGTRITITKPLEHEPHQSGHR